nr:zinc finger, CCHC-type [Tanacetum cinerariifolium]
MFKPLTIVIAVTMGVLFLGDSLNLGSVIGGIIITIGFYGVVWGKAKEEHAPLLDQTTPLLPGPHDMTTSVGNNSVFRSFFEKQKLTGPTSLIGTENYVCSRCMGQRTKELVVLKLLTMDLEIQQNLAYLGTYDMLLELKALYSKQGEQELLQTVREFHTCKQEEGQSVRSHVLKMKGYIDNLERLSQPVGQNLAGLRGSKKLKQGALSLYVDDGHCAAIEAIGTYHLELPSGLVIFLNNCH